MKVMFRIWRKLKILCSCCMQMKPKQGSFDHCIVVFSLNIICDNVTVLLAVTMLPNLSVNKCLFSIFGRRVQYQGFVTLRGKTVMLKIPKSIGKTLRLLGNMTRCILLSFLFHIYFKREKIRERENL